MIIGNCFGSGCTGPKGQHVVMDFGDYLYCLTCDSALKPEGNLWWRKPKQESHEESKGAFDGAD